MTPEEMQALNKALEAARDYADAILLKPLNQLGGILSDTIGYWRLRNQVRLLLKAKTYLEENNVDAAKVLPDVFVPLLEDGSQVEDETLSDMFASLLASHLDPDRQESIHRSYTKVLAQLSPIDATMMLEFRKYASYEQAREVGLRGAVVTVEFVAQSIQTPNKTAYLSCLNLERLGIIEHLGYRPPDEHPVPEIFEDSMEHQEYRITEYGIAFCDACHSYQEDVY
jgi:hypothetical protein